MYFRLPLTQHLLTGNILACEGTVDTTGGSEEGIQSQLEGEGGRSRANYVNFIFLEIVSGIVESRRGHGFSPLPGDQTAWYKLILRTMSSVPGRGGKESTKCSSVIWASCGSRQ